MNRPVRLCADPATIDRIRASRTPSPAAFAALEAENARLRGILSNVGAVEEAHHVLAGVDMEMSVTEARLYSLLRRADGPRIGPSIAADLSTGRRKVTANAVHVFVRNCNKKLAQAGSGLAIRHRVGEGYRLVEVPA